MVSWGSFWFLGLGSDETIRQSRRGNCFGNDLPGGLGMMFACIADANVLALER